ncbi:MAG: hypothetical protein HYY37_06905 [Candidatus Aenigmarchaeota archaeon]|nr:hypothetical protein [Candidatus Aenigmarchaeota archaeon]
MVTANEVYHAAGVLVDRSSTPNKVYVVDTGNNRILGFNGIGYCTNSASTPCTIDSDCSAGGTCSIDGTKNADIVFGQPDFTSAACNGDNNLGFTKPPTASTMCLTAYPFGTNVAEQWAHSNIDVDSEGNLYMVDRYNNRVLKYNKPFSTDTSADFVWGQPNFISNGRNRGPHFGTLAAPTSSSLATSLAPIDAGSAVGVSVDNKGNVWVADTFNSRVLRFPANSETADLVLGKPDFTTNGCVYDGSLNRMCVPILARVDPETGNLYVIDEYPSPFKARILVFRPPFTNGMPASKKIVPTQGPFWGEGTGYFFQASGFVFNTYKQGAYAAGKLWVNEHAAFRTILIDDDGNIIKVIGAKNATGRGGDTQYSSQCGSIYDGFKLWFPGGSIGIDSANNIYLADEQFHSISRYALPYETRTVSGSTCLPLPNGGLFPAPSAQEGRGPNRWSDEKLGESVGLVVFQNQLIVKDEKRLKVWNNYLAKNSGDKADFEVSGYGIRDMRGLLSDAVDDANRLWFFNEFGLLRVDQLPYRSGSAPLANNLKLYWHDDGSKITYRVYGSGIAFDKIHKKIYLVDAPNNRILRISNYNDFNSGRLNVDMVIGQPDKATTSCNHGSGTVVADGLCEPYQIKFDRLGNLYVVENSYECHGNDRITVFLADDLWDAQGLFPGLQAKKVFVANSLTEKGPCAFDTVDKPGSPVSIAFNSRNQMVIGNDGYYGNEQERHRKQLWLYRDPLHKQTPDASINLVMGAPGEMTFDANDNLIVQDHTWSRVWIIDNLDALSSTTTTTTISTPSCTLSSASVSLNDANGNGKADKGETVSIRETFSGSCQPEKADMYLQIDAKNCRDNDKNNICDGAPDTTVCDVQYTGGDMSGMTQGNVDISVVSTYEGTQIVSTTYISTWTVPTVHPDCSGKTVYGWAAALWSGPPGIGTRISTILEDSSPADAQPVSGSLAFPDVDITPPSISRASVEGDTASPYYDTVADGNTDIIINGESLMTCRFYLTDVAYSDASGTLCTTSGTQATCIVPTTSGLYTRYIGCKDSAGNRQSAAQSLDVTWTVDTGAPETTLIAYSPDPASDHTPTYSGSAVDALLAIEHAEYRYKSSTGEWSGWASVDAFVPAKSVSFTFTMPPLADGTYAIEVRAYDAAGNVDPTVASDTLTIAPPETTTIPSCTLLYGGTGLLDANSNGKADRGETVVMDVMGSGFCQSGENVYFQIDAKNCKDDDRNNICDGTPDTVVCDVQYTGGDMSGVTRPNPDVFNNIYYQGTWTVPFVHHDCAGKNAYVWAIALWSGTPGTGTRISTVLEHSSSMAAQPVTGSLLFHVPDPSDTPEQEKKPTRKTSVASIESIPVRQTDGLPFPVYDEVNDGDTNIVVNIEMGMTCRFYLSDVAYSDASGTLCTTSGTQATCIVPTSSGSYTRYIGCKDARGRGQPPSENLDVTWVVDLAAPETTIETSSSLIQGLVLATNIVTSDHTPTYRGSAVDALSEIVRVEYRYKSSAGEWSGWASVDAFVPAKSVSFTFTMPPLADGTYAIEVRAYDAAGYRDPTPATDTLTIAPPETTTSTTTTTTTTTIPAPSGVVNEVKLMIKPVPYDFRVRLDFYNSSGFIGSVPVTIAANTRQIEVDVRSLNLDREVHRSMYVVLNSPLLVGQMKFYIA